MTRKYIDVRHLASTVALAAIAFSSGCVAYATQPSAPSGPPNSEYEPPVYEGEPGRSPDDRAPPYDSEPVAGEPCTLDAPRLITVVREPINGQGSPKRNMRILTNGAWIVDEAGQRQTGCLQPRQLARISNAVAAAQFEVPPPPPMRCRALPMVKITVRDNRARRRVSYEQPCGEPVDESIYRLVRMTGAWTDGWQGTSRPPARPPVAMPIPAPAPVPAPKPHPALKPCRHNAPVAFAIRTSDIATPQHPHRVFRVLDSGAWILSVGDNKRQGCLGDRQMATLERELERADFSTAPTSEFTCAAVPTTAVRIVDRRSGHERRVATYTTPCGTQAHSSVYSLMQLASNWAEIRLDAPVPTADAAPIRRPQPRPTPGPGQVARCQFDGAPIYREASWLLRDNRQRTAPRNELVLYPSGAWSLKAGKQYRTGCIAPNQVQNLRQRADRAALILTPVKGPQCKALVSHYHELSLARGIVTWEGPCNSTEPHSSVVQLRKSVRATLGV